MHGRLKARPELFECLMASGGGNPGVSVGAGQCVRLLEDGGFRLLEDGNIRLLESCNDYLLDGDGYIIYDGDGNPITVQ